MWSGGRDAEASWSTRSGCWDPVTGGQPAAILQLLQTVKYIISARKRSWVKISTRNTRICTCKKSGPTLVVTCTMYVCVSEELKSLREQESVLFNGINPNLLYFFCTLNMSDYLYLTSWPPSSLLRGVETEWSRDILYWNKNHDLVNNSSFIYNDVCTSDIYRG